MKSLLLLSIPIALLLAFGGVVLFWAGISQIRFLSYFKGEDHCPPPLGFAGWVAFYRRTLSGAYSLLWWSFRAAFHTGLRQPSRATSGRPVLCIHGLFLNSTCMWGIRRRLEQEGRPTRAVFMGVPLPTPMSYATPLIRVMRELAEQFPDQGFDIAAHSIGGVMIREVLRRHPELADNVHRVVTLGSPHHGTAVVRWIRFGPVYKMLARNSKYLQELGNLHELAPRSVTTTVATLHDLVVYPTETCHLEGSRQVTLDRISHLGLMTEERSIDEVEKALATSPGPVGQGPILG